jgi:eukaryotic-like serine/threonine-protein kinase
VSLASGTKLSRYEIRSKIGAGGMGEVYRARDEKLNREVAIKVLPASLSQDEDRLRRFEQEAQAAGALNHPNILAVYDVGTHEGAPYIVSELLEGEELRAQLNHSSLPQRKALDYAQQIAQGLAAAHERGITHRDLKPENLFVTADGRVKILDFGLAKLRPQRSESVSSEIDTRKQITDPGTVMGTVGYMSPEQVRAQTIDHRSDIFAFGLILYEMLAGKRAFEGTSAVELMNAILKEEPRELSETNPKISLPLEKIVRRCLEKKPERRFQTASDLAFALEALSTLSGSEFETATGAPATSDDHAFEARTWFVRNALWAWISVGVLFLVGLLLAIPYLFGSAVTTPAVTRLTISLPEELIIESLALSPDGTRLALSGRDESGKTLIWIRALDTLTPQALPGTEGARFPFWSPDSRSVGFFADSKLKRIEIAGGSIHILADTSLEPRGASWGRDGTILFSPGTTTPLYRVSATGGSASLLTQFDSSRREGSHRWPYWLPDGRHFIYFARGAIKEKQALFLASLDSKDPKLLLNVESSVAYMPSDISSRRPGLLVFMRERALMAQPFDADKQALFGEPYPIAEDVVHYGEIGPTDLGVFSISANGVLCYQTGNKSLSQLTWVDRSGKQLGTVGPAGSFIEPALSPDGRRVAVTMEKEAPGDPADIWILELAHGTFTRLTTAPRLDQRPSWSPDGSRIVFGSDRNGVFELYQKASSGAGSDELLLRGQTDQNMLAEDWSLDGRFIIYGVGRYGTGTDLWILPLEGDRKPYPYLQTQFNESHARFSPDVKWVAYVSDESGRAEVYVQSFPPSGGKWQISNSGGDQPQWRRDGRELFYLSPDRKIMAAQVKTGTSFETGVPAPLFQTGVNPTTSTNARNNYVVAADGQRFLINNILQESASKTVTVVLNWTAQLKK